MAIRMYSEMAEDKQTCNEEPTYHVKSVEGKVVALRCCYYKRWMPLIGVGAVEFGTNQFTDSGYNYMCTSGARFWIEQNRVAKLENEALLDRLEAGDLTTDQLPALRVWIEHDRRYVVKTSSGFAARDEVVAHLKAQGISIAE